MKSIKKLTLKWFEEIKLEEEKSNKIWEKRKLFLDKPEAINEGKPSSTNKNQKQPNHRNAVDRRPPINNKRNDVGPVPKNNDKQSFDLTNLGEVLSKLLSTYNGNQENQRYFQRKPERHAKR